MYNYNFSFASRAKSVKNKPQINEVMSDAALLKRYARQLAKLQEELQVFNLNYYDDKFFIFLISSRVVIA